MKVSNKRVLRELQNNERGVRYFRRCFNCGFGFETAGTPHKCPRCGKEHCMIIEKVIK